MAPEWMVMAGMNGRSASKPRERDVFLEALEQPTLDARAAYLDRACQGDAALRGAVEALLANHRTDEFLETPAIGSAPDANLLKGAAETDIAAVAEKPGDRIGRYKLLQEIGEGACGTVFMAEQEEPVRRRVALKVIKPGMDTKTVIARFEAERQALALMDHPNIAKVLDAGTSETGRPFFVMELVRGIRITEYCDQNHLSTVDRLDLFVQVCHAIEHAHQKAVIHRDIKPSNILVTLHDGVPVPKVIDFGIAKAIEQRLTDKTVFTQFQAFIGTPAYTSPEQAEMSGLDIDTRSDIYSLGVLLYELLTGETPFNPKELLESGLDEMRRIIREEEPQRPSTRLSTMGVAAAHSLTRSRQSAVPALVQAVKGDLDWIVMKCLEKDRTRRYPTASALAADVERYLKNEPVLARPPSTAYRIRKFARRNRVIVTASAAVAVTLAGALVLSTWLAIRARRAERAQATMRHTAELARQNEAEHRKDAERERLVALRRAYTSDMNLVQAALAANNYGRVIDLLSRHRPAAALTNASATVASQPSPDFRQWEWRYFWKLSQSDAAFDFEQQAAPINSIAVSPNGRLVVTGDRSGATKLWDVSARREIAAIPNRGFGAFAFSRDGARLAVASGRGRGGSTVKIWTVASRDFTEEMPAASDIELLAFSLDDSRLLGFGMNGTIRLWDLESRTSESRTTVPLQDRRQRHTAAFSPDAQWIAVSHAGGIQVFNVQTGEARASIQSPEGDHWTLAFSPDGEILAAGASFSATSTAIKLFSTADGKLLGELAGHVSWIPALTFTPDGTRLISAGADQSIRIWNVAERRPFASLRGHLSEIYAVAVTPDGKTILSGCKDGTLFGWDLQALKPKAPFETVPGRITSVEFFPDSRAMLSANANGSVSLWNPDSLQEHEVIANLGTDVARILISPDGTRVYAGTRQGGLRVLDWATRLVITNLAGGAGYGRRPGPGGPPPGGSFGPVGLVDNGRTLVTAGPSGMIRLVDTASWQTKGEWRLGEGPGWFAQFQLGPDQRSLAVAGMNATEIRNVFTGQVQATLVAPQNWGFSGLAFSPDGALLATSSVDGNVHLWDRQSEKLLDVVRGHLLGVHGVGFSPDGERLATISYGDEAVKLWDVETRHEVATLAGQGGMFHAVTFSPDGRLVIAVNMEQTAYVWRAPSHAEITAWESGRRGLAPRPMRGGG
jgi:WD40 repeat protein/serine/threonine protein kinase